MKHMTKILAAVTALALVSGCAAAGQTTAGAAEKENSAAVMAAPLSAVTQTETAAAAAETAAVRPDSEYFTDRDFDITYSDYVTVSLSDGASAADGAGVTAAGDTVTITEAGTYLLAGTLTDGQIVVDAADDAKVQLVLDGVSVTGAGSAALYIRNADKVFLTTAAGSSNVLVSVGEYVQTDDNNVDGAVFSKCDLTMNGGGALTVSSESGHGVVCKDDLKITSGAYEITAAKDGLSANDSIRIAGGDIDISAGSDGIQADSDDTEKGYILILGGTFAIICENDALEASSSVTVEDGDFTVTAGGGKANAPVQESYWNSPMRGMFANENAWEDAEADASGSDSHKGVKADGTIDISGGTFRLDTADDAIHSNGSVEISGGVFVITSGDDGVHADYAVTISGGTLDVTAHEGVEGMYVTVSGGELELVTDDDGFNASGSSPVLTISGGVIRVNSEGDSLDANGNLVVTGGEIYITGPSNSGNGMLDYDRGGSISGGVVIGTGVSGMQENFDSGSAQGSILYTLGSVMPAGTEVELWDADGSVIARTTAEESFQIVLVSAPEIEAGGAYTLVVGGQSYEITMNSLLYGAGGGFGAMGGFGSGRGGKGGF